MPCWLILARMRSTSASSAWRRCCSFNAAAYLARSLAVSFGAYAVGLAENDIRLLVTGNAGVVEAIVAGEIDAGMTDTDDAWRSVGATGFGARLLAELAAGFAPPKR